MEVYLHSFLALELNGMSVELDASAILLARKDVPLTIEQETGRVPEASGCVEEGKFFFRLSGIEPRFRSTVTVLTALLLFIVVVSCLGF
jgi:hypothetical protein